MNFSQDELNLLRRIAWVAEWQVGPSGESYCAFCYRDTDGGEDGTSSQKRHHRGCEWVKVFKLISKAIGKGR